MNINTNNAIVSQVHVPPFDPQGSLKWEDKKRLVEFGIKHLRAFNPNAYIAFTGHGFRPDKEFLDLCDFVYWNDQHEPLNEHGYVIGMPAQFKYVSKGLDHVQDKGYRNVLKTRGDCIIGYINAPLVYQNIIEQERKKLLITQQTGTSEMGDCFMYGNTDVLAATWHEDNSVESFDGLKNTAIHFRWEVDGENNTDWKTLLKKHCAFRDVDEMKCMCLRWNYRELDGLSPEMQSRLLDPSFDFARFHWGKANNWHYRDRSGKFIVNASYLWSMEQFYE